MEKVICKWLFNTLQTRPLLVQPSSSDVPPTQKSADPSRRDMEISYAGSKRCRVRPHPNQNPKSKIQTPNSKLQNPKSKIQNPNSKIQNPKSKIQTPKSKLQNPKSKRPVWSLDFGFWAWSGREWRRWLCSKWWCMAVLATRIWPSWRRTSLQPKGSRLDSPRARPKLGTDFRRRGFAGNRAPISGPASWKSGPSFRRNCGPGGAAQNVRSTSRGAEHVCKCKGLSTSRAIDHMCICKRRQHRIALWIFAAMGIYTLQASFSNKTYFWTKPSQISKIIISHLNKSYLAVFADLKLNASWL